MSAKVWFSEMDGNSSVDISFIHSIYIYSAINHKCRAPFLNKICLKEQLCYILSSRYGKINEFHQNWKCSKEGKPYQTHIGEDRLICLECWNSACLVKHVKWSLRKNRKHNKAQQILHPSVSHLPLQENKFTHLQKYKEAFVWIILVLGEDIVINIIKTKQTLRRRPT